MTDRKKREPPLKLDMDFAEAIERFANADSKELAESAAADVLHRKEAAEKKISKIREELRDGARPRKGRFRL